MLTASKPTHAQRQVSELSTVSGDINNSGETSHREINRETNARAEISISGEQQNPSTTTPAQGQGLGGGRGDLASPTWYPPLLHPPPHTYTYIHIHDPHYYHLYQSPSLTLPFHLDPYCPLTPLPSLSFPSSSSSPSSPTSPPSLTLPSPPPPHPPSPPPPPGPHFLL